LAGDRGLVVILLNKKVASNFGKDEAPFHYTPQRNVKVWVGVPKGIRISKVLELTATGSRPVSYQSKGQRITWSADFVDLTRQYLLITTSKM